jgi:hypothetical protein
MKFIGIIFIALIIFAFLGTSTPVIGKSKVCQRSEKGFWKTMENIDHNINITSIDNIDILISTKAQMEMNFNEVKILCDTVEEDIDIQYKKTKNAIEAQIELLQHTEPS